VKAPAVATAAAAAAAAAATAAAAAAGKKAGPAAGAPGRVTERATIPLNWTVMAFPLRAAPLAPPHGHGPLLRPRRDGAVGEAVGAAAFPA